MARKVPARPAPLAFRQGDILRMDGIEYRFSGRRLHNYLMQRLDLPDSPPEHFSVEDLHRLRKDGKLIMVSKQKREGREDLVLSALPERSLKRFLFRKRFCDAVLQAQDRLGSMPTGKRLEQIIADCHARYQEDEARLQTADGRVGKPVSTLTRPSARSVERWLRAHRNFGDHGLVLRYSRSGHRTRQLDCELELLLEQHVDRYASRKCPAKKVVYRQFVDAAESLNAERTGRGEPPLPIPCYRTFDRRIRRRDQIEIAAARLGRDHVIRKFGATHEGVRTSRALERIEIDHVTLDVHVIEADRDLWESLSPEEREKLPRRRYMASVAIDVHTRCILAVWLTRTASSQSAIAALRMVLEEKTAIAQALGCESPWQMHGHPECVVTDAGSEFISDEFLSRAADLGTTVMRPPVGNPGLRGTIESFFRTLSIHLSGELTGRSFANVVARGDYDGQANASILLGDLYKLLFRYIVDIYHNEVHSGLGTTPREAWQRAQAEYCTMLAPDPDRLRAIFGLPLERKLSPRGVRVFGNHYQSEELQALRRKDLKATVRFRIDPHDLSAISVEMDGGWHTVRMVDDRGRLPLHEWLERLRKLSWERMKTDVKGRGIRRKAWEAIQETARAAEELTGVPDHGWTQKQMDEVDKALGRTFAYFEARQGENMEGDPLFPDLELQEMAEEQDAATPEVGKAAMEWEDDSSPPLIDYSSVNKGE